MRKIPSFHLICWRGNFAEKHSFSIVLGELPEIMRKLFLSSKISTPENQVRLRYFSQFSTSNLVLDFDIFTVERIKTTLMLGKWQMHEPLIFNLKGLCESFLFGIKFEMHLINVLEKSRRFYYVYYLCLFQISSLFITFLKKSSANHLIHFKRHLMFHMLFHVSYFIFVTMASLKKTIIVNQFRF